MPNLNTIQDVVDWRLCLGCGACSYICPSQNIKLVDIVETGIRPVLNSQSNCADCRECLEVCPSYEVDFGELKRRPDYNCSVDKNTESNWGAITGIWEGHSSDQEIRHKGSSGGALTALSLFCLEQENFEGVLHIAENPDNPVRNKTRVSRNRADLLEAVGSRYSPASVCDGLENVEKAERPFVVIGKPVEIAATRKAMRLRPALKANVGVTLSFFCAETPPTAATQELLRKFDVSEENLRTLRYRGHGWPGYFTTREGENEPRQHWIYQRSWAYLQKFRPWGVHLWPDGAGELADISCGDPWYEEPDGKNPGFSLIVTRTTRGKAIVEAAISKGYLSASPAESWKLDKSQEGLLRKKGATWGRRLAQSLLGVPNTKYRDLDLFGPWLKLSLKEKIKSTIGTVRRMIQRGLWKREQRQKT